MAGVGPAGRATALGRHCRASRSAPWSFLASPRLAEQSGAAGLTGLPLTELAFPPPPGKSLAGPARVADLQARGAGGSLSWGLPRPRPGEALPLPRPRGSRGHDREPPGFRGPSGPSRASLRLPEEPGQSARSTNAAPDGCPTPAGEVDMRLAGPLRIVALVITVGLTWLVASILLGGPGGGFPRIQQLFASPENSVTAEPRARKYKCGLPQPCPEEHLAFRMVSGAANVIGPKICLEDRMLMSSVKDNVGRGLNIALVNGVSGELIEARAFDMWAGDVNDLLKFIRPLHEGTLVFVASYDDPATKMNEETRKLFSDLGSKNVKDLAFRDSWVFVGAKGVQNKSPFEQHVKNSKHTNKYEGWPEALEMEGCIPRRTTAS
ncbi:protein FAM3A isoform X1 [Eubalaena glacialis]|uniref:protein FAM3A isoform X1 n=2 Tax=Eubalaena glacialis TaxID=27606 RepID=UPI002A5AFE6C|nr:protein FAM3A isoform X1 [Eubalaena glacialis]